MWNVPLFPPTASDTAGRVDAVMFFVLAVTTAIAAGVAAFILFFALRYHYKRQADRKGARSFHLPLEIAWTAVPLALVLVMFVLGARAFVGLRRTPKDALEVYVVGKQWMWKIQHPNGRREIDELHIPVGRPVKLLMTSQDVIHSFYIPAFRIKQDVLPGRYTEQWFTATEPGAYHLFCAEYCGTAHSGMIGRVVAMPPKDYQRWLTETVSNSMADEGAKVLRQYGCVACHRNDPQRRGPVLEGLYGQPVRLQDGRTVTADAPYIRESILKPAAKIVEGFEAVMPTYQNQINEEEILQLIAYLKSTKR